MVETDPFFSIVLFEYKADPDLGANSRAHWTTIRKKQKADKYLAAVQLTNELNRMGLNGHQFLTNLGEHTLEDCLPVHITFKRFYAGRARKWDEDNLFSAFKALQDGIKHVLEVDDRDFKTSVEQVKDEFNELEVIIEPAWSVKK